MGQICSGTKGEAKKGSAFEDVSSSVAIDESMNDNSQQHPSSAQTPTSSSMNDPNDPNIPSSQHQQSHQYQQQHQQQHQHHQQQQQHAQQNQPTPEEKRKLLEQRQEQQRLDMIVQTAGRGMVPVRSMRGSNGYYDQGFAAALRQHLEQTTTFEPNVPIVLPPPSTSSSSIPSNSNVAQLSVSSQRLYNQLSEPSSLLPSSFAALQVKGPNVESGPNGGGGVVQQGLSESTSDGNQAAKSKDGHTAHPPPPIPPVERNDGDKNNNPVVTANNFMDSIAEIVLDVASQPQSLLTGVKPVVENLL